MTIIKNRTELPVFGDMMANLFEDRFFEPIKRFAMQKTPSVNIFEDEASFTIQLASPGLKKEDFTIDLKNNLLSISAGESKKEVEETETKYAVREFNFTHFKRNFNLPKNTNPSEIKAQYTDGILEVVIGKKERESEILKKIEIS